MVKKSNQAISVADREWRAKNDAHTLAEARAITADPSRHKAAIKAAGTIANEQMTQAKCLKQVANKKVK